MWEFPGGKIELGESRADALRREFREELSLEVVVGAEVVTTTYEYSFAEVTLTTFMCKYQSGEACLNEHQAAVWLAASELRALDWAPADLPAVQALPPMLMADSQAGARP